MWCVLSELTLQYRGTSEHFVGFDQLEAGDVALDNLAEDTGDRGAHVDSVGRDDGSHRQVTCRHAPGAIETHPR